MNARLALLAAGCVLGGLLCIGISHPPKRANAPLDAGHVTATSSPDAGPLLHLEVNFGLEPVTPHVDEDTRVAIGVRNVGAEPVHGLVLETHASESVSWVNGDADLKQRGLFSTARTWPTERSIAPGDLSIFHLVFRPEKAGRMRLRVGVLHAVSEAGAEVEQSFLVTP